jgi:hypothetical protein
MVKLSRDWAISLSVPYSAMIAHGNSCSGIGGSRIYDETFLFAVWELFISLDFLNPALFGIRACKGKRREARAFGNSRRSDCHPPECYLLSRSLPSGFR